MVKPQPDHGEKKTKTTKGRQGIPIAYIEDKQKRQVSFSKRKPGLLNKVSELSLLTGAHAAAVVFSKKQQQDRQPAAAGRRRPRDGSVFAVGTPSVDHVARLAGAGAGASSYLAALEDARAVAARERAAVETAARRRDEARARVDAEEARMKAVAAKVRQATAQGRFWWEADVEALGEAELPEFGRALKRLRDNVRRRADKL